jgi:hypothetical protein
VGEEAQVWKTGAVASAGAVGRETQAARTARATLRRGLRHAEESGERSGSGSARPGPWARRGREAARIRGRHGRTGRAASAGRRGAHGRHARAWQRSSAWVDDGTHQSGFGLEGGNARGVNVRGRATSGRPGNGRRMRGGDLGRKESVAETRGDELPHTHGSCSDGLRERSGRTAVRSRACSQGTT